MPDTGGRREITQRVNAKEAETVQESKKLLSRTRQLSARTNTWNRKNKARAAKTGKTSPSR